MTNYFPILKTKAGEVVALDRLDLPAKDKITPVVRIVLAPPGGFIQGMVNAWAGRRMALDGSHSFRSIGSLAPFHAIFAGLGAGGVEVMPSVSMSDDPAYVAAAIGAVGLHAPGILVKAGIGDIQALGGWMAARGLFPADVDLMIQAGDVSGQPFPAYAAFVAHQMQQLPNPDVWRSVILHSSAAPLDHGGLQQGATLVPRLDWQLWQYVSQAVPYELHYGDCGHVHASMAEVPGAAMGKATVSARYTTDQGWIVCKGVRATGPGGITMPVQFRGHAQTFRNANGFGGLQGCWGDTQIAAYVLGQGSLGSRGKWVEVSMNRHLSLVADRLP